MPIEYREADQDVHDLLGQVMTQYFPELASLEPPLNIDIRMVVDDHGKGLMHRGHPAAGMIEIVSPEERSAGGPDVRIKLDYMRWLNDSERQHEALIHHEVNHLIPKYDQTSGSLRLDPYGRPVVKLRRDDWMLTGFSATVQIFGADAMERRSLDTVEEKIRSFQLELPFVAPVDDVPVTPKRGRKTKQPQTEAN